MDPNANLAEQRQIANRVMNAGYPEADALEDLPRLAELVEALDQWIRKGGFLPADWKRTDVYVSMPDEPFVGDELYVFDTDDAAEAFCELRGSRHVSAEPVLDMKFVDEARAAELATANDELAAGSTRSLTELEAEIEAEEA